MWKYLIVVKMAEKKKPGTASYHDALAARHMLLAQHAAPAISGADLYQQALSSVAILSTGCTSLDRLLDGGLYGSEVTEVAGPTASGKTQVCISSALHLSRVVQQNSIYIDTKGGLDTARIQDILEAAVSTEQEALNVCSKIQCHQAFDVQELLNVLETIKENLKTQRDEFYRNVKLIVLDSITSVILPILGGQNAEGHGLMMHVARALKSLASQFSLAVLVTNNMVGGFEGVSRPALGRSWQYVPNTRLELQTQNNTAPGTIRAATLTKSSRQPLGNRVLFKITNAGLEEVNPTT